MSEENKTQNTTQYEELATSLRTRFGDDWRKVLSLQIRADNLYWLIMLAEEGIRSRIRTAKMDGDFDRMDFRMSVGSWRGDVENLVSQAKEAPVVKPSQLKKGIKHESI